MEDWKAIPSVIGLILWILWLAWKKRNSGRARAKKPTAVDPSVPRPSHDRKTQEFKRDYEPIEPGWRGS